MAYAVNLRTHPHWEDWLSLALGLLVVIAPWLFLATDIHGEIMQYIAINAFVAGLCIASLSALEIEVLEPWEEWFNLAFGLWVAASPWVFGYVHIANLMWAHVILGLMVVGLAALEIWQDRHRPTAAH